MPQIKKHVRMFVPKSLLSLYHRSFPFLGSLWYGNPSKDLVVIAVTGTKGKSSTIEYLNAAFEAAGYRTALLSGIRTKILTESRPNTSRMSTPGRFAIQRFLYNAKQAGCTHVILEMTSEGARLHRHLHINFDGLIFTNLAPEHIESHGGLDNYIAAKVSIGYAVAHSPKKKRVLIACKDDPVSARFAALPFTEKILCSVNDAAPYSYKDRAVTATILGAPVQLSHPGEFSLLNALCASFMAHAFGVTPLHIATGMGALSVIPGRVQFIDAGQDFDVVVDYAHTKESLEALYRAFEGRRKICVLGATGGGRDTWKRPVMGGAADMYCDEIILTNEDPYDEDPQTIVNAVASGITKKKPEQILDRRAAIRAACTRAHKGDVVLVTGKGTDPTIQTKNGTSFPWSDARVCKEVLAGILAQAK